MTRSTDCWAVWRTSSTVEEVSATEATCSVTVAACSAVAAEILLLAAADVIRGLLHLTGELAQIGQHLCEGIAQGVLLRAGFDGSGQIALGDLVDRLGHLAQEIDHVVEVIYDFIEFAIVGSGDLGGEVSEADPFDILGCDAQGSGDRIEGVIDALDEVSEIPLVFGGIGAGGEVAFDGGLDQHVDIGDLGLDGLAHLGVSVCGFSQLDNHLVEVLGQIAEFVFCFDLERLGLDLGGLRQIAAG